MYYINTDYRLLITLRHKPSLQFSIPSLGLPDLWLVVFCSSVLQRSVGVRYCILHSALPVCSFVAKNCCLLLGPLQSCRQPSLFDLIMALIIDGNRVMDNGDMSGADKAELQEKFDSVSYYHLQIISCVVYFVCCKIDLICPSQVLNLSFLLYIQALQVTALLICCLQYYKLLYRTIYSCLLTNICKYYEWWFFSSVS